MIGQISASNQLRTISELAPNMLAASSELASVMEFRFYQLNDSVKECGSNDEIRREEIKNQLQHSMAQCDLFETNA